ncbi:MAG: ZIP family metal transporter [Gammaproteobacteria bacterium]|nr:MAG: ZIP family metal transporter [Gammaproteobacteria bacterium]
MDPVFGWIILFTALGGVLSIIGAAVLLVLPQTLNARLLPRLVSFAIGALLGAAFLALIPHALQSSDSVDVHKISGTILLGLLLFFLLEKMVIWRHCHSHDCEAHALDADKIHDLAAGELILIGDGIHNLVDGVLIAAAFLTDIHLGVVTALAVAAHEIPQEVGDFAILLHGGMNKKRAFVYNMLSSLTSVIGGVIAYFWLSTVQGILPYILALAASSFIYIAVADLIPELHKRVEAGATMQQAGLIAMGVITIYLLHSTLH